MPAKINKQKTDIFLRIKQDPDFSYPNIPNAQNAIQITWYINNQENLNLGGKRESSYVNSEMTKMLELPDIVEADIITMLLEVRPNN